MSIRLRELIRAVRACKTLAEERESIAKECAAIRTAFKDEDNPYRHRNVAKLLFIHMLGYPTHFGQMECLKLIASQKFPEKRIGYLGLMLLLDEDTEVLMLVTNSLKNDLNHANQFIVGQALCALGNIGSADMCQDLASEVEKLLHSTNAYIRKKAVLAMLRICRKCPHMIENYVDRLASLLNDRSHGVLAGALALLIEMCETDPTLIPNFRVLGPQLLKMLKNLVLSGYAPEHDVSGITDPFLQVRILRCLRYLAASDKGTTDAIADILAQVATNTEASKNAGNAILYECVLTIIGIEADSGLRVLAVNILGRFLLNRDNNIRYVGLNTLALLASSDVKAVQRHRATIVECLQDPDISIRRRALDLVYLLVNPSNVRALVKELLNYLHNADPEFKDDLTSKICQVVGKHSPNKKFQTETLIKVLAEAGEHVQDQVTATLPVLISADSALQSYAVHSMFRTLEQEKGRAKVSSIAAWCVGEYGELLAANCPAEDCAELTAVPVDRVVAVLTDILDSSLSAVLVKQYVLTALIKLCSRYPKAQEVLRAAMAKHATSIVVELQQRAHEYGHLAKMDAKLLRDITEHMPSAEDETASGGGGGGGAEVAGSGGGQPLAKPASAADDLLGLLDDGPSPSQMPPTGRAVTSSNSGTGVDLLDHIFGAAPPHPATAGGGGGGGGLGGMGDMLGGRVGGGLGGGLGEVSVGGGGGGGGAVDLLADLLGGGGAVGGGPSCRERDGCG